MLANTYKMIRAVNKMYPVVTFFKDRYFPDGATYYSEYALIETKKKGRKIAPFVIPMAHGIPMEDEGYRAERVKAPYIAPTKRITADDLEKKAFGEEPNSGRKPSDRASLVQAEHMDDLRQSIYRRHEKMCTELLLSGELIMRHFSTANDAAKNMNYKEETLRFYDKEKGFENIFKLPENFQSLTAAKKIAALYSMASELRSRGVTATDLVMTNDVSMELMTDIEFLKFFDLAKVEIGAIKPKELPDGVVCHGGINIRGIIFTMFTYDEKFEDLDGAEKEFLPKGTIMMLKPGMGETAYAQVTFIENGDFKSYAKKIVPRAIVDEKNNISETQMFSRPVPFPKDTQGWLVANVYDENVSESDTGTGSGTGETDTHSDDGGFTGDDEPEYLSADAIQAMTKKVDVITYAESIGLTGLTDADKLDDLKTAVLNYQEELLAGTGV